MNARQLKRARAQVLLIAAFVLSGMHASAAWHVLLDGVDISGSASPLERGGTILVNATALAPVLHLQMTVRGNLVTIRDVHGTDWQTQDGSITLLGGGRSLNLPYPLLLLEGNIYLPIETLNSLVDHHLILDEAGAATLASENIGDKSVGDGWQSINIPKPVLPPGPQPVTTAFDGSNGNATAITLPPTTDTVLLDIGVGYAQSADMDMDLNAAGACFSDELLMNGLITHGAQGTRLNNGYLSLLNRASGYGIEIGNLTSDLLGGVDGMRFNWRRDTNRWSALSLYWERPSGDLARPVMSYRNELTWGRFLSVGGEVDSRGEVELHSRYQPGRLGLYTDFRDTRDAAQSGTSLFMTYAVRNGITASGGMSRDGSGASQSNMSNMAIRVPIRPGFDFTLVHSRSQQGTGTGTAANDAMLPPQGSGSVNTNNAAMLTVPAGPLRLYLRFSVGQTANNSPDAPSLNSYRDFMASTGYNIRPTLRADLQIMSRWQGDGPVERTSQFVGTYRMSPRSDVQLVSSLPYLGPSNQFHLRWKYTLSQVTALTLDYGQISPFQSGSTTSGCGVTVMLHSRWGISTPTRGASVTGTVSDEAGRPLSDCLVRLGDYCTTTDISGRYHFEHVPAGIHEIALDNGSLPANDRGLTGVYRFSVRNGDRITRDFRLIPLYLIRGKVLLADSDGKIIDGGVSGVVVHLGDAATVTDTTGVFRFYNLAPGAYTVRLDARRLPTTLALVGANELSVTLQSSGESPELIFKVMPHDKDIIYQYIPGSGK